MVAIAVRCDDDGPASTAARLQRVFELFLHHQTDRHHGVGLAMAKRLVERRGGTIDAASTVGEGDVHDPLAGGGPRTPQLRPRAKRTADRTTPRRLARTDAAMPNFSSQ